MVIEGAERLSNVTSKGEEEGGREEEEGSALFLDRLAACRCNPCCPLVLSCLVLSCLVQSSLVQTRLDQSVEGLNSRTRARRRW